MQERYLVEKFCNKITLMNDPWSTLKQMREKLSISQKNLAAKMRVSQYIIWKYENGKIPPKRDLITKYISAILEYRPNEGIKTLKKHIYNNSNTIKEPIYNEIKTGIDGIERDLFNLYLKDKHYLNSEKFFFLDIKAYNTSKPKIREKIIRSVDKIFKEYERFPEMWELFNPEDKSITIKRDYFAYNAYKEFYYYPKRKLLEGELDLGKRKILARKLEELGIQKTDIIKIVNETKSLDDLERYLNKRLF